ncbi:MAG: LytTR family DNA-binding domain-containing protein, partial [Bacteroidota bacterium]
SLVRICIQILLSGLFFYSLVGSTSELKLLFAVLMMTNILAVFLSTLITTTIGKNRMILSALFNAGVVLVFFLTGHYLQDLLTYEVIEEMSEDLNDPSAIVVKARLVSYGGVQFMLIGIVHSLLSYLDFLEIRLSGGEAEPAEFSKNVFSVKVGKKLHLIPFEEIDFIEASGNYIHIFQGEKKFPARLTLQEFTEKVQSENLIRIHRSFMVNLTQIRELEGTNDGYLAVLRSGKKIKVGKQYKSMLFERLGIE